MRQRIRAGVILAIVVGGLVVPFLKANPIWADTVFQTTPQPFVLVSEGFAKVRTGPGTVYDELGQLNAGQTAPASGRSARGEWVQIDYAAAPGDKGWVYAPFISIEGGALESLPVVEAPPTPTLPPLPSGSIDSLPTLAPTRRPTFTSGPPVSVPTFETGASGGGFPPALVIIGLFGVGIFGGIMAFLRRNA